MFRRLTLVLAQDDEYAQRFQFLGVPDKRLRVVGSLKYDTAPTDPDTVPLDDSIEKLKFRETDLIWVAGSTGPGEETIILDCFDRLQKIRPLENLRLVIVPRKPERFDEVARLIDADAVIYQDLEDLVGAVRNGHSQIQRMCTACFSGVYPTGDITAETLLQIERERTNSHE